MEKENETAEAPKSIGKLTVFNNRKSVYQKIKKEKYNSGCTQELSAWKTLAHAKINYKENKLLLLGRQRCFLDLQSLSCKVILWFSGGFQAQGV